METAVYCLEQVTAQRARRQGLPFTQVMRDQTGYFVLVTSSIFHEVTLQLFAFYREGGRSRSWLVIQLFIDLRPKAGMCPHFILVYKAVQCSFEHLSES